METKELKIQAPKGYEIDKENSTLECIRFKPIKKNITYKEVCDNVLNSGYYTNNQGIIIGVIDYSDRVKTDKNNATNSKQLERILALNQLLNIAEYYNNKNISNKSSYIIYYSEILNRYSTSKAKSTYNNGVIAMFNRVEDAQAVIDNPNFREILDTIYKD